MSENKRFQLQESKSRKYSHFFSFLLVMGLVTQGLCMSDKHSTTQLHPSSINCFLTSLFSLVAQKTFYFFFSLRYLVIQSKSYDPRPHTNLLKIKNRKVSTSSGKSLEPSKYGWHSAGQWRQSDPDTYGCFSSCLPSVCQFGWLVCCSISSQPSPCYVTAHPQ